MRIPKPACILYDTVLPLRHRPNDLRVRLTRRKDHATVERHGEVLRVCRAHDVAQGRLGRQVDQTADVGPVDGGGAHGARLPGGDEGAGGEVGPVEVVGGVAGEFAFGVADVGERVG